MPKNIRSKNKKARTLGFSLRGDGREFNKGKKRTFSPGIHGKKNEGKTKIKSEYRLQLEEKQKVMYSYGLRDYQLKNLYRKAEKIRSGGFNPLVELESRIYNVVFRSGIANTRYFARQLISHRHFFLIEKEGKEPKIIKSFFYKLKAGQIIGLRKEKMINNKHIEKNLKENKKIPNYILFDKKSLTITYSRDPLESELGENIKNIKISLVSEWYN